MEACLGEELPAPTDLEEALRNGVILAKVGHRFAPTAVALKKIFDLEQQRYQVREGGPLLVVTEITLIRLNETLLYSSLTTFDSFSSTAITHSQ